MPLTVKFPVIVTFPPINAEPANPKPPDTLKAPVVVLLDTVVLVIDTGPPIFADTPTLIDPAIPTPPSTINAPAPILVDTFVFAIYTWPLDINPANVPTDVILGWLAVANVPVILPATDNIPPIYAFPANPKPPDTLKAPVIVLFDEVVLVIITAPLDDRPFVINPVKLPSDVILGWLAVWIVPVKVTADKFLILEISLFESTINALLASAIPNVVIVV